MPYNVQLAGQLTFTDAVTNVSIFERALNSLFVANSNVVVSAALTILGTGPTQDLPLPSFFNNGINTVGAFYVYIKNLDSVNSVSVTLQDIGGGSAGASVILLGPGALFIFAPSQEGTVPNIITSISAITTVSTASALIEYAAAA